MAIGVFDGVHLGHKTVITHALAEAKERGTTVTVVTFEPHPAYVLRPESAPLLLTCLDAKLELLEAAGVDVTVIVSFDKDRAKETAHDFVQRLLVDTLAATKIIVGSDFHFGYKREGSVAMLEKLGLENGFSVDPITLFEQDDSAIEPVSSTAIRRALAGGNIALAASMLGRSYEVRGTVVQGDQRGRTIGFPTANVAIDEHIALPADAVYAGWYSRPDGTRHTCAINLGKRPTFHQHAQRSLLEAHLLDFDGDLYGEAATIEFAALLRSEKRFAGVDELVAQLHKDVEQAHMILSAA